ncbi:MAG: DUF5615 family PIN-like protein [Dehalococcoidia bacterium]
MTDENFRKAIVRGLLHPRPTLDIIRVQDAGLSGAIDPAILAWAAQEGRVLLPHDIRTMPSYAYDRVREGLPMPGVLAIGSRVPIGVAIKWILQMAEQSPEDELKNQVRYLR